MSRGHDPGACVREGISGVDMQWGTGNQVGQLYGAATISRLLKMIGLFCRISSLL